VRVVSTIDLPFILFFYLSSKVGLPFGLLFIPTGKIRTWEDTHRQEFHYSSGFQAVVTALALCEKVDLYGFGIHSDWKHHFHTDKEREHYAHDFEGEYLFYHDLAAKRIYDNPYLCEAGIYIPPVQVFH
jgi:hypothetical protein